MGHFDLLFTVTTRDPAMARYELRIRGILYRNTMGAAEDAEAGLVKQQRHLPFQPRSSPVSASAKTPNMHRWRSPRRKDLEREREGGGFWESTGFYVERYPRS